MRKFSRIAVVMLSMFLIVACCNTRFALESTSTNVGDAFPNIVAMAFWLVTGVLYVGVAFVADIVFLGGWGCGDVAQLNQIEERVVVAQTARVQIGTLSELSPRDIPKFNQTVLSLPDGSREIVYYSCTNEGKPGAIFVSDMSNIIDKT